MSANVRDAIAKREAARRPVIVPKKAKGEPKPVEAPVVVEDAPVVVDDAPVVTEP